MEHIIFSNIMSHVETHQVLSDMQFGFHKRLSAELQLLQTIHDLSFNLNNRGQADVILQGRRKWSGCSAFGQTSFSQGKSEIQFLQKGSIKQKCSCDFRFGHQNTLELLCVLPTSDDGKV